MNLGKIKASKKQMDREDRINWGGRRRSNLIEKRGSSAISEGKDEEVDDEAKK